HLDSHRDNESDVAIKHVHRGKQKNQPDDEQALDQKHRNDQQGHETDRNVVKPQQNNKERNADAKVDHGGGNHREGDELSRKIDLLHQDLVAEQAAGAPAQDSGKKLPGNQRAVGKQSVGHAVTREAGKKREDDRKDDHQ